MLKMYFSMFFMSYEVYKIMYSDKEIRNRELAKDYNRIKCKEKRKEYAKNYLDLDFKVYNVINIVYWFYLMYLLFNGAFLSLSLMILPYFINKVKDKYLAIKIDSILSIFILLLCAMNIF